MTAPVNDPIRLFSSAIDAFNGGDWRNAQRLATQVALYAPSHGGVHFIAGVAALQLSQLPRAIDHLQRATQCSPDRADYLAQYARALAMAGHTREAVAVADRVFELHSQDARTYDTLGVVYSKANAHKQAADAFCRAVELQPDHANYRFNLATSFMYFGDLDAAEREYGACIAIDPRYWRAYLGLSQLRKQTSNRNHIARTRDLLLRDPLDAEARLYLHLSLAKELEDIGDYPQAFDSYRRGKAAHGVRIGSSGVRDSATFDAIERYFDGVRSGAPGDDSSEPIFVVGMPRTGTTLVDRILSAHSAVHSAGELGSFSAVLHRAAGRPARSLAETLANLDRSGVDWSRLGREYVESTRPGTGHTPNFVDKLPHNFLYLGFIGHALPKAKIICLRRNPMDTCLSNFRQLFALESPYHDYSYDLIETGRYYLRFVRLMRYWHRLLPDRIMEIDYERLVDEQENVTHELLDFCELPWESACLRFESNEAPVATASAVQVRSGMNRDSCQRWKRYDTQLKELRRLLEEGGVHIE